MIWWFPGKAKTTQVYEANHGYINVHAIVGEHYAEAHMLQVYTAPDGATDAAVEDASAAGAEANASAEADASAAATPEAADPQDDAEHQSDDGRLSTIIEGSKAVDPKPPLRSLFVVTMPTRRVKRQ